MLSLRTSRVNKINIYPLEKKQKWNINVQLPLNLRIKNCLAQTS